MTTERSLAARIARDAQQRKDFWRPRNEAINQVFDILTMVDKNKVTGYESHVVSDLRAGYNVAVHILSANQLRHRLPATASPIDDVAQRQAKNLGERFLYGNWRLADSRFRRAGREAFLRQAASWPLATGWYCFFSQVRVREGGRPEFLVDVLDISEIYPEWGGLDVGLTNLDREYMTTAGEFKRRYPDASLPNGTKNTDKIVVLDDWELRYNKLKPDEPDIVNTLCVLGTQRQTAYAIKTDSDLGSARVVYSQDMKDMVRLPFNLGPAGGIPTPSSYFSDPRRAATYQGQSMLATSVKVYETLNHWWQLAMQDVRESVKQILIHQSPGGQRMADAEELQKVSNVIAIGLQEAITKLDKQSSVGAASVIIDNLNQQLQRAMFPWTQFGQANIELSGIAIERLNEQARAVVGPSLIAVQDAVSDIDYQWLADWKRLAEKGKADGELRVAGRIPGASDGNSGYYDELINVEQLPETHYIDVTLRPALPVDRMIRAQVARTLIPGNEPILDLETVLEEVMDEQDPQGRMRRIQEEQFLRDPRVIAANGSIRAKQEAAAAMERNDQESAQMWMRLAQTLEQVSQQLEQPGEGIPSNAGAPPTLPQPNGNGRPSPISQPGQVARPAPR